jgi:tetratricopeptide (TPR) repeat protein
MEANSSSTEKSYQERYQAGIISFEHGDYKHAIAQFQQALDGVDAKTKIGGEIQVWLANAYDAVGDSTQAIALCRRLKTHGDRDVRKSANYVLGILTAPQLSTLKDVVSQIPSLQGLDAQDTQSYPPGRSGSQSTSSKTEQEILAAPRVDNVAVQRQLNRFIWTATIAIALAALIVWAVC